MQKTGLIALGFWAASAFGQEPAKEPDTLKALLAEVHQLRQNLEGMTVASQRVQIALYMLQTQDAAVTRSAQRLDSLRSRCSGTDEARQHTAADIQLLERNFSSGNFNQTETEAVKQRMNELKRHLDAQTAEVQTCQAGEAEASSQLRNDQGKLMELQERILRLDKALEQFGTGK